MGSNSDLDKALSFLQACLRGNPALGPSAEWDRLGDEIKALRDRSLQVSWKSVEQVPDTEVAYEKGREAGRTEALSESSKLGVKARREAEEENRQLLVHRFQTGIQEGKASRDAEVDRLQQEIEAIKREVAAEAQRTDQAITRLQAQVVAADAIQGKAVKRLQEVVEDRDRLRRERDELALQVEAYRRSERVSTTPGRAAGSVRTGLPQPRAATVPPTPPAASQQHTPAPHGTGQPAPSRPASPPTASPPAPPVSGHPEPDGAAVAPQRTPEPAYSAPVVPPAASPPAPAHDGTPAGAFVHWCRSGDGLMDRAYRFAESSRFEVKSVHRECNALGLEFAEQPRDPAEYWLMRHGMDHLLFPQPQSSRTFRELDDRLFDATCTVPSQLTSMEPCRVEVEGANLRVKAKGRLS